MIPPPKMNTYQALRRLLDACSTAYTSGIDRPSIVAVLDAVDSLGNADALLDDIEEYLGGLSDGAPDAKGYAQEANRLHARLKAYRSNTEISGRAENGGTKHV